MTKPNPNKHCKDDCVRTAVRYCEVELPMDVSAKAEIGRVETCCCGEPAVEAQEKNNGCRLVVRQRLKISVPIVYEAVVTADCPQCFCKDGDCH